MTAVQLALLEIPPTVVALTEKQTAVLNAVAGAHQDGLTADEAGAVLHALKDGRWAHSAQDRCAYCARDGNAYLRRLAELGHVRYRRAKPNRPGGWVTAGAQEPQPSGMLRDDEAIPF